MKEKDAFVERLKKRTKKFGVDTILFCDSLKKNKASLVIANQLIKSATSAGANYRAACRSRSQDEFYNKIYIVAEATDESVFWLEVIKDAGLSKNPVKLEELLKDGTEILKIVTRSKDTTYKNIHS